MAPRVGVFQRKGPRVKVIQKFRESRRPLRSMRYRSFFLLWGKLVTQQLILCHPPLLHRSVVPECNSVCCTLNGLLLPVPSSAEKKEREKRGEVWAESSTCYFLIFNRVQVHTNHHGSYLESLPTEVTKMEWQKLDSNEGRKWYDKTFF